MYKHKYLKYKFKYLQLTKQFGGECDTETQQDEVDPVFFWPLKSFKPEERITLGKREGNPGKCMLVKSAFYTNILAKIPSILGTRIPIEENEKIIIKQKFKELYFKMITFKPAGAPHGTSEMAVCISNILMIPFNGYYQPLEIPIEISLVEYIEPYNIGCLVIIRGLISFLDPPPPGVAVGSTYNTQTMNGSLGVIIGIENSRYNILILAPDSKIKQFQKKHADTLPTTQEEINDYYRKYGLIGSYITKRQLISIRRENLELV
jgi:hypothetical protein